MISLAISSMSSTLKPRRRSAALAIIEGSVETPMVNVLGTLILMFCRERAPLRSMLIVIGLSEMYA